MICSILTAALVACSSRTVEAAGNADLELGLGAFIGIGNNKSVQAGAAYTAAVAVGIASHLDAEVGATLAKADNDTGNLPFGTSPPSEKITAFNAGLRFFPFSKDPKDVSRVFVMAGVGYMDGFPAKDLSTPGSRDKRGGRGYIGPGLKLLVTDHAGVVLKAPFYIRSLSNRNDTAWVPTASLFWRFE